MDEYREKKASNVGMFYGEPKYTKFENSVFCKTPVPKHSTMNVRLVFQSEIQYKKVQDVFTRLSQKELLKRCLDKWTQNVNESFNSKIWRLCLKDSYRSYPVMVFAICQSILHYHLGMEEGNILWIFNISTTEAMRKLWNTAEKRRVMPHKSKPKKRRQLFDEVEEGQEGYDKGAYKKSYLGGGYNEL